MSLLPVSHSDTQTVNSSLFSNGASFSLYPFTPQQIHIWTSPKPTAEMTGKRRPVIDKNLHNDKKAWNQVLLTSCNVSRKHRWDELGEAIGNTANFKRRYFVCTAECTDYLWRFGKNKDEALSSNLMTRPHVSNNYKVCARRWNDAQNYCWSN